ncbi:hypothetical protein [Flavobacterium sp.]
MKNIIYILIAICFSSCLGTKEISKTDTNTKQSDKTEINNDKKSEVNTNQAIDDKFNIPVRSNDEAVNEAIRKAFRDFGYNKQSGSNSTNMTFDPDLMAFKIANYIGETQNKTDTSTSDTKIEKSFEQITDEYLSKKMKLIPWWVYVIVGLYFLPKIIEGVTAIVNPVSSLVVKLKKGNTIGS